MANHISRVSLAPVWVALAVVLLSLTWLLPNHARPWSSFHSDAWIAVVLASISLVVLVRATQGLVWHGLALVVAFLVPLPFLQLATGLLPFAGQAWIASAYLLGLFLALLVGQQWHGWRQVCMGDILFLAIGIASVVSVGLQLQQWLGLTRDGSLDVWVSSVDGVRPYANMGQPNQLATLLLWGMLAGGWGAWRGHIGRGAALLLAAFLILGLALTQSRSGAIGLVAIVLAVWWWRPLWANGRTHLYASGLTALYGVVLLALTPLSQLLMLEAPVSMTDRLTGELRPKLWRMLVDAAWQRPFSGYGWNEVIPAQLNVADHHPAMGYPFSQSHNLFLDFVLWAGLPVGLLLTACVLAWLLTVARRVRRAPEAVYFLFVMVVGIHAMLEFPLHYAYCLLPVGLVMGALNAELGIWRINHNPHRGGRWFLLGVWCLGAVLLGVVVRDYFRAEAAYAALQIENAGIKNSRPVQPPDVLILTQLREAQRFMKFDPAVRVSPAELQWARDVTQIAPSSRNFMALAVLLGLNRQTEEAQSWLVKMCRVVPRDQCASAPAKWAHAQKLHPSLAPVAWPAKAELHGAAGH
ncbi:Wzy polymerase domain-containing protein [Variovorax sp. J22G21]|uniref:PglL family O-oligosaccharyltransferase n=1 Tax=Variovorax fucosicus TaxID=3053517 RepID=UPI002577D5C8|nr:MULTISPECIES: O-antigen ligase family protein [unclassified Variovorax]MDM0039456.1 Wzy polymerase domain-containing protein [Variovorax sp. J22R193]MDM0064231.1 Wzy polymerase domain-containing protein [Variovorax sp. J22G21]